MPIERRIREGAERNAGILDPDVDRFLDAVVHKARRRQVVRRSLTGVAAAAAVALAVFVGPSVLDGHPGRERERARRQPHAERGPQRAAGGRVPHG